MRELLRDARERFEVVERSLSALGIARAESWRDELLDERRLAPGGRQDRAQMPRIDAEAREPRRGRGDVGLAFAIEVVTALDARDDDSELLELAQKLGS